MFWPKQYTGIVSLLPLLLLQSQIAHAFVVPQELPSLLSVVYSNIPPIKKGTDSRLGFGFRLGEHADFQVLVELGPQKETRPVGEPSKDDQSFNKRQVSANDQRALLRQQIREQQRQQLEAQQLTSTERTAASWLESWSNGMKPQKHKAQQQQKVKVTAAKLANAAAAVQMPQNAMQQLQQLYKMATSSTTATTTTALEPQTTTTTTAPAILETNFKYMQPSGFKLPPAALLQDTNTLSISLPKKSPAEITKQLMDVSLETV